jgi:hypothetical protein
MKLIIKILRFKYNLILPNKLYLKIIFFFKWVFLFHLNFRIKFQKKNLKINYEKLKIKIFLNLFMIFIKLDFGFKKFNYFKN